MEDPRITRIEWGRLEGQRPRGAGVNARIGVHGKTVRPAVARLTTEDGSTGFGVARATRDQAQALIGQRLSSAFSMPGPQGSPKGAPEGNLQGSAGNEGATGGASEPWIPLEYPLFDLVARREGLPVYALLAQMAGRGATSLPAPFRVPCYDTSLYIDDLHLEEDAAGAALIAAEAREGYERGHRAFKIKVGRGGKQMPLEAGTRRDIAVVRAVREAVGPEPPIMIDANNGYNFNLARRVLAETAESRVFWLEEAFHEDAALYRELKEWMAREGIATLIADGEGQASPTLLDWAREGVVDVVQYDYLSYGCTRWLATGKLLDSWDRRAAPHHYGGHYGNYVSGHLAGAIQGFTFVEWDEASTPGLDGSAYAVHEGQVTLPAAPGFGLHLDDTVFARAVAADGYSLEA
jgi:L-alanine-DL-glutamate epimerase-like enolase superfamily enzyme